MRLYRKNPMCEVTEREHDYIVVDDSKGKYLTIKKNDYVNFVLSNLESNLLSKEDLIDLSHKKKLTYEKISEVIEKMINHNILRYDYFPIDEFYQNLNLEKVPEMYFEERFGQEIAWLLPYETKELSRFDIFSKLQKMHVCVIGAGGVGSEISVLLSGIGIEELTIIDGDTVELSNLTRQRYYKERHVNKVLKTDALREFISEYNSKIRINTVERYIYSKENLKSYLKIKPDIIIQTADNPRGYIDRYVNDYCVETGVSCIFSHHNSVGPFFVPGISNCYSCFEKSLDNRSKGYYSELILLNRDRGSRTSSSFITGPILNSYYLANEIVKFAVNPKTITLKNKIIMFDRPYEKMDYIDFLAVEHCKCVHADG